MNSQNLFNEFHPEVLAHLDRCAQHDRAESARNDKKSQLQFLAVHMPDIRRIAKVHFSFCDQSDAEIASIWSSLWFNSPYFEVMSVAAHYYIERVDRINRATWYRLADWPDR